VLADNFKFRAQMTNISALNNVIGYAGIGSLILAGYSIEGGVLAESVNITEENTTIDVGNTQTLTATVLPENTTNKELAWKSSDSSVATVDASGTVTAVSEETAIITAKAVGTNIEDTCTVTVQSAVLIPSVTSVTPGFGPEAGGTEVAITGTGFIGATDVKFGTTPAAGFSVLSDTSIVAVAPAGHDTVDITVTTDSGTSAVVEEARFIYTKSTFTTLTGPSTAGC